MSATIYFKNETSTGVTFGLYSAPHNYSMSQGVSASSDAKQDMDHPDARTVGVWINSNTFYPNNDSPFVAAYFFEDGENYQITLTATALNIEQQS